MAIWNIGNDLSFRRRQSNRDLFSKHWPFVGRQNLGTFDVTEYVTNNKYGFKSLSGPVRTQTSYTFEMPDGGTRINISTRAHMVDFFQMDERILGKR